MGNGMTTGKKLRILRSRAGLTQQEIADLLHMDRSTYAYYESDTTHPRVETLQQLAHVFGVPITALLSEDIAMPQVHSPHKRFPPASAQEVDARKPSAPSTATTYLPVNSLEQQLLKLFRLSDEPARNRVLQFLWQKYLNRTMRASEQIDLDTAHTKGPPKG